MTGCICLQGIIISQCDQYDYHKRQEDYIISFVNNGITFFYCVVCIFRDVDVNIFKSIYKIIMGLNAGKAGILHTKNKGADQPVHLRSLISAFVICLFESKIS